MRPSLVWLGLWCISLILAPLAAPHDPLAIDNGPLLAPSEQHWLGTDSLGRDVLSRVLYGGRITLITGAIAAGVGLVLGTPLGLIATLALRPLRGIAITMTTALAALPSLVLAMVTITLLGQGFGQIAAAVGISQAPAVALFTGEMSRSILTETYVVSARAAGASEWGIAVRHVWPNLRATWGGFAIIIFAQCIMNTTALGFLGLSGDLSAPEWGSMLAEARQVIRSAPWMGIPAGAGIAVTIWLANRAAAGFTRER